MPGIQAQDLQLNSFVEKDFSEQKEFASFQTNTKPYFDTITDASAPLALNPVSPAYLPEFARKNPTGYTYLCRLELKIEKDLPLGLWLDIGDKSTTMNPSNANANVRFRFKLK